MLQSGIQLPKWLFLVLLFPLLFLDGWLLLRLAQALEPLLSTSVTALILSFLLDYPIRFLEKKGVSRNLATGLVLLLALLILAVLASTLLPQVLQQSAEVTTRIPQWIDSGRKQLHAFSESEFAQNFPVDLGNIATQAIDTIAVQLQSFSGRTLGFIFSTAGSVVNLFITLVLTVFLALNGQKIWDGVLSWLPAVWQDYLRSSLRQSFEVYFTGQATLAIIASGILIIVFFLLRIPYALLFGLVIGLASFIPYGSTVTTLVISTLVAFQNVRLGGEVLAAAVITGQVVDNFISPRILGQATGLNPVWLILSLLIGAKLGSILGLLIAVPLASFVKRTFDKLRTDDTLEEPLR
ncbi:MAG: AI-2E family transporter [Oscillatoriales cyanobacterium C42_A2020_001]|nr:AI-2E family transporter [Leptolyngbyaceae cyanobacterium C42_A2020_001]